MATLSRRALCRALTFTLLTASLFAQSDELRLPADVQALIPAKTEILGVATADLNGDDLPDHVVVAQETASADPEDATRTVLVIEQKAEGQFAVATRNDRAVISRQNGGLSDSFGGISAEKKTFTLSHQGGRRESAPRITPLLSLALTRRGN